MNPSEEIRPCRVLLVDDSESYRTALSKLLSREKDVSIVGEASNGRAALDLAIRLRPDVIIMDVMCPKSQKNVTILRHSIAVGVGSPSEIQRIRRARLAIGRRTKGARFHGRSHPQNEGWPVYWLVHQISRQRWEA